MSEAQLLALSPLDGRYAAKVDALRPVFSEYGLVRARVRVEVEWLLALAAEPGIVELAPFAPGAIARLRALADGFSVADAARVKEIERTTNHDVKAVEYFIKERLQGDADLGPALEFVHFACTSEDVNNLSYALMLSEGRDRIALPKLDELVSKLRAGGNFGSQRWQQGFRALVSYVSRIEIVVRVTHAVKYWKVFEFGAVIKGRPLLWIPLSFAKDAIGKRARDYPGPLFRVDRKGKAPLLLTTGGVPKYFGKESVKIPKKFHLRSIVRKNARRMKVWYKEGMKRGRK
jgi:hypothetical protein